MKKQLTTLSISLFFISTLTIAQGKTIWFDANWNETTKDKAIYFREEPQEKGNGYWFKDYYISGKIQMEGLSLKKEIEFYEGLITWYYENGKIFQKVNYINGYLSGERLIYYEDGSLKAKLLYNRGRKNGLSREYYKDGRLKTQGNYNNNKKVGTWKHFYYDGGSLEDE